MTGTVTGLFTHKSVPVIFEAPCIIYGTKFYGLSATLSTAQNFKWTTFVHPFTAPCGKTA
jgi:hypothetical protein